MHVRLQFTVWVYGYCMVTAWLLYGYCMVIVWLLYGYCMIIVWLLYGYCIVHENNYTKT